MAEPLVYTVEQVAELLGIGRTATYQAVRRGEIPSVRIGHSIRCPRHALEQFLSTGNGADGETGVSDVSEDGMRHGQR